MMTRARVALAVLGAAVMAYAVVGALTDPGVKPIGVAIFLVAVLVLHDAVWMLVVLLAGAVLSRWVPVRFRTLVRVALLTVAAVAVVALPLALGFGRAADNPSALPLPYGRNLLAVLAGIVVLTALVITLRRRKDSESPRKGGSDATDR
jgi:hypothetical protein